MHCSHDGFSSSCKLDWHPYSWRSFSAKHQPVYCDPDVSQQIVLSLTDLDGWVSYTDVTKLRGSISNLQSENSFFLQVGDCAERFDSINEKNISLFCSFVDAMEDVLLQKKNKVLKIGRIAGQFSKPRSHNFERVDDIVLPVYRGDMVNSVVFSPEARIHCPNRMLQAYEHSIMAYSMLQKHNTTIYTSHEALVLEYEAAMTRKIPDGSYMNTSAHFLWVGNRTRFLGSAHLEYVRGISNPIGIKIDSSINSLDLVKLIKLINPGNVHGKVVVICRFGCQNILRLSGIMSTLKAESLNVNWVCDPMHGNTIYHCGQKFRTVRAVKEELKLFFEICSKETVYPSGIQLECTPQNVMECFAHEDNIDFDTWLGHFDCDPRLNWGQSMEVVNFITEELL